MEMPLEIEFKSLPSSPALSAVIRGRVAKLERLYDRITSCRVSVEAPHRHQQQGKQYAVHVCLQVPGATLICSRDHQDAGHDNPYVAVRDAFDAMQRQLEAYLRRPRAERGDAQMHVAA